MEKRLFFMCTFVCDIRDDAQVNELYLHIHNLLIFYRNNVILLFVIRNFKWLLENYTVLQRTIHLYS